MVITHWCKAPSHSDQARASYTLRYYYRSLIELITKTERSVNMFLRITVPFALVFCLCICICVSGCFVCRCVCQCVCMFPLSFCFSFCCLDQSMNSFSTVFRSTTNINKMFFEVCVRLKMTSIFVHKFFIQQIFGCY